MDRTVQRTLLTALVCQMVLQAVVPNMVWLFSKLFSSESLLPIHQIETALAIFPKLRRELGSGPIKLLAGTATH